MEKRWVSGSVVESAALYHLPSSIFHYRRSLLSKHYNSRALPLDLRRSHTRLARLHMTSRFISFAVLLLVLQTVNFPQQPQSAQKAPPVQMDGEAAGLMQGW